MSQPTQMPNGTPDGGYCVIDNSAAPTFVTFDAGTHIGYDTTSPGAIDQGVNYKPNGTIPDFLAAATKYSFTGANAVYFKNPS